MSAWERLFDAETLSKAKNDVRIKNVKRTSRQITAQTYETNYELKAPIKYNSPYHPTCTCEKKGHCEHEAALRYYIDEHSELLQDSDDINRIINSMKKQTLKEFILKELKRNTKLTRDFIKEFSDKEEIDEEFYHTKLTNILRKGEGPDFFLHHLYDFERIETKLKRFMQNEVHNLLKDEEYEVGWELLYRIADVLNDELSINQDAWSNLAKEYIKYADPLLESLYLSKDQINQLELKTKEISKYI